MPTLTRNLPLHQFIFIGDVSVRFEHHDPADRSVMLVIGDPSKTWLRRHQPVTLKTPESTKLPNGAVIQLVADFRQSVILRITSDLPIRSHAQRMAEVELAGRSAFEALH